MCRTNNCLGSMIQIQMINISSKKKESANSPKYNSKRIQSSLGKLNSARSEEIDYKSKELTTKIEKERTEWATQLKELSD